jgi:hypothetical protein
MLQLSYTKEASDLALLLQAGFQVEALVGCTLREFLCIEMEICGDYAKRRIQTIFIDGMAVDDFDEAQINPGCRLALSGAMPGLVGAVMRRGGFYSKLRDDITYNLDELRPENVQGIVNMRLYNFIAEELAEIFLRRGIIVEAEKFLDFLHRRPDTVSAFQCASGQESFAAVHNRVLQNVKQLPDPVRIKGALQETEEAAEQGADSDSVE